MRQLLAVVVSGCTLIATPAIGEVNFPYKAYITADDVYVRSGPGQSYYPTNKLKAGQEVEIYRHDPGGWYAIRPPEGSFTWVSGRFLELEGDNLAVVTDDRLAARVGSRFSDIRDVIQVRLHKGEVVEVLEAKESGSGSGKTTWYKIAPPSGEFRWVFGKYVDPDYPHDGLRKTHAADRLAQGDSARKEPAVSSMPRVATPARTHQESPATDSTVIKIPTAADPAWRPGVPAQPSSAPVASRGLSPAEYQEALERIDMELSAMVVEEPTVWSFQEMRQRAERLLEDAETAVERGRAGVLVRKMDRFEQIKRRYDAMNLARAKIERSDRRLAGLGGEDRGARREVYFDDRYDGVGQLTRVVSPKLGAPRYALVDQFGGVRCYVSPAPGVPLRHYIGRQVGVNGTRGYMPEQRAQHIMARHVTILDGRMR